MTFILSVLYFIGLVMFGAAIGDLHDSTAFSYVIIGACTMFFAGGAGILMYLHKRD